MQQPPVRPGFPRYLILIGSIGHQVRLCKEAGKTWQWHQLLVAIAKIEQLCADIRLELLRQNGVDESQADETPPPTKMDTLKNVMDPWLFIHDHPPTEPGIYAVINCWDAEEGMFPGYDTWDGSKWSSTGVLCRSSSPFQTKELAEAWAYKNDLEK